MKITHPDGRPAPNKNIEVKVSADGKKDIEMKRNINNGVYDFQIIPEAGTKSYSIRVSSKNSDGVSMVLVFVIHTKTSWS